MTSSEHSNCASPNLGIGEPMGKREYPDEASNHDADCDREGTAILGDPDFFMKAVGDGIAGSFDCRIENLDKYDQRYGADQ